MSAFVVRTEFADSESTIQFWKSLLGGTARIGWSYRDDLDLRKIVDANNQGRWELLNAEQRDAWRCHGFVDRGGAGDHLFYPNLPEYGQFVVVKLSAGDYQFLDADHSINGDFRSARPCELLTTTPLAKSDHIVHPWLRSRLGLQGRFYELYDQEIVESLFRLLREGRAGQTDVNQKEILTNLINEIADQVVWPRSFPRQNLSTILSSTLEDLGYTVQLQEGRGEAGSDLVVQVTDDLLPIPIVVGVQVGSYEAEVHPGQVRTKLQQLLDGWDINHLSFGVLILTGKCGPEARQIVLDHNRESVNRMVKLIDGADLARMVLVRSTGDAVPRTK